jgi:hypothetical protein
MLASFLSVAGERDPKAVFDLTTRDDPSKVRLAIDRDGRLGARLRIAPSALGDVQRVLQDQTASVMFFTEGLGELGSSPTRMAEILGCGLPVVTNDGVGDVARVIRGYRVGVLAHGSDPAAMIAA